MEIDSKILNIWYNTTFRITSFGRNFDYVTDNENIITEHSGNISLIRLDEFLPPIPMGQFELSTWNIKLGKLLEIDFDSLIDSYKVETTYSELKRVVNDKSLNILDYDRIVFVHNLVLHPNYRKHEIVEEFVEMLYKEYSGERVAIISLVMPIQYNPMLSEIYFYYDDVEVKKTLTDDDYEYIPSAQYYSLNDLAKFNDRETNEYKLFAVASRCGFNRIGESYLFILNPQKTLKRIKNKKNLTNVILSLKRNK